MISISCLRCHKRAVLVCGLSCVLATTFGCGAVQAKNKSAGSLVKLDNVVVSAAGFEQMLDDAPASISVIPRQELQKKAYRDITDALADIPGVFITGSGSARDISVRGMAPGYTMILVDGQRQNSRETRPNADGPGIEQGWLPPLQAIERIEVIRGPMSSLYGSDAMGGVVNIITRKVASEWMGSARAEITAQEDSRSGDQYQGSVYAAGPLVSDRLGIQAWAEKSRRQEDRIEHGFNRQDTESGTVKLGFSPSSDHDVMAEAAHTRQNRTSTPGRSIALETSTGAPNTPSVTDYDQARYALTHIGRFGGISSNSYWQHNDFDNPTRDMRLRSNELNSQWNIPLNRQLLSVGAQYQNETLDDFGNQYRPEVSRLERYQWAVYGEDEWLMTDSLALTGGLRMTRDENYGTHWTPRLYAVWHAAPGLSVKAGLSTGFKAPGLRQTVADWGQITGGRGGVPAIIMGNPDLKPEKSVSQELGVTWSAESWTGSLTLFNTGFRDKISEVRRCTDPDDQPTCHVFPGDEGYKFISDRVNVDRAALRGVEATANWQLRDDISLAANYTYTWSRQKSGDFAGQPLNKIPEHMLNTTLEWTPTDWVSAWSRVNFRGRTSDYLSRTAMAKGTPSYAFADAGINYSFSRQVSAGLGVYNLLDKRVSYEDYDEVHDGRRYWAQLTVSF